MTFLNGPHLSYDFILVDGEIKWFICFQGYPSGKGMFDRWETLPNKELPIFLTEWISKYLNQSDKKYTSKIRHGRWIHECCLYIKIFIRKNKRV